MPSILSCTKSPLSTIDSQRKLPPPTAAYATALNQLSQSKRYLLQLGESRLLRSILAGQSTFLIPEVFLEQFSSCCQIFQQLSNDNVAAVVAPSVSILEAHTRRQAYKDSLQQGIVDPGIIDVTFNDFPYYSRYSYLVQQASGAKEVNTTIKESSRPERASVFAKRAPGRNLLPHQKPTPLRKVFSTFKKGIYCHINVDVGCDAMDNSLQAVWSNDQNDRRLKRGEMGALLHRTSGSVRDPSGDELELSPGGSFTKCDDLSEGKTIMPIEFQVSLGLTLYSSIESLLHVNGEDLAEIPSVKVAVTHLNSCNGLEFVLQFRFELNHGIATTISSPGSRSSNEANARLGAQAEDISDPKHPHDCVKSKVHKSSIKVVR
ncbi:hypothetical protein Tco_1561504 [Tanacetum coccineum]